MSATDVLERGTTGHALPRIGFLGVGWIGRNRMNAIARAGVAEIAAVADSSAEALEAAHQDAPEAMAADGLDAMLEAGIEGIVIATPSALHARQSIAALEHGVPVFCQKPLGRTAAEVRAVVEAARAADLLLGVDMSYRFTDAMRRVRETVAAGVIGRVHAVDLVFHNAYGPDKAWFHDPALSGGGCVMDLGVHLVDIALWTLGFPKVEKVHGRLHARGRMLAPDPDEVEDYALATLELESGVVVRLACSWYLPAGKDAHISASFYGTEGGAAFANVGGSFFDFVAERYHGTVSETLATPPDDWGGRAAVDWAARLAAGEGFDPAGERLVDVAETLDRIYGRI